ncbi:unnamed protein product [Amoebophrya sp. A25]|nr:unnamed protein product [Amoebophrya sp. A25]|eukprot:GSA25T00023379001.1
MNVFILQQIRQKRDRANALENFGQILLMDNIPQNVYEDALYQAFTTKRGRSEEVLRRWNSRRPGAPTSPSRSSSWGRDNLPQMMSHMVWHIESPESIIYPKPRFLHCAAPSLWFAFREHVIGSYFPPAGSVPVENKAHQLGEPLLQLRARSADPPRSRHNETNISARGVGVIVPSQSVSEELGEAASVGPQITVLLRRRSRFKKVGRVFADITERDLQEILAAANFVPDPIFVDFGSPPRRQGSDPLAHGIYSFREQLSVMAKTSVLIGTHGAGLMHVIFMEKEGVLVEIHPFYRRNYHFLFAARMMGKTYMPLRARYTDFFSGAGGASCDEESDQVVVDRQTLEQVLDAATRVARAFGGRDVFCGLVCSRLQLAMATMLAPVQASTEKTNSDVGLIRSREIFEKFPCPNAIPDTHALKQADARYSGLSGQRLGRSANSLGWLNSTTIAAMRTRRAREQVTAHSLFEHGSGQQMMAEGLTSTPWQARLNSDASSARPSEFRTDKEPPNMSGTFFQTSRIEAACQEEAQVGPPSGAGVNRVSASQLRASRSGMKIDSDA